MEVFLWVVFVLSGIIFVLLILKTVYHWGRRRRNKQSVELKSLPSSNKLKKW